MQHVHGKKGYQTWGLYADLMHMCTCTYKKNGAPAWGGGECNCTAASHTLTHRHGEVHISMACFFRHWDQSEVVHPVDNDDPPTPPPLSFLWKSHLLHTLPQSVEFKLLKTHQWATPVHSVSRLLQRGQLGFVLMQFHQDKRIKSVLICSYECTLSSCWRTDCLDSISICVFSFRTWSYRFQSSTGHNRLRVEWNGLALLVQVLSVTVSPIL